MKAPFSTLSAAACSRRLIGFVLMMLDSKKSMEGTFDLDVKCEDNRA